jgi:hypothetical protein
MAQPYSTGYKKRGGTRHIINPLTGRQVLFGKKTFYNLVRDGVLNADGSARIPYREYNIEDDVPNMIPLRRVRPFVIKSESTLEKIRKILFRAGENPSITQYKEILKLIKLETKILKEFETIILTEITNIVQEA